MTPRLEINRLSKTYASPVLRDVTLSVHPGEIVALLGANGAGKSTISRIIAGLVTPTSGSMSLDGKPYSPASKAAAEHCGVQIVQQELNQIDTLSVAENLFLNRLPHRLGFLSKRKLRTLAATALETVGLQSIDPETRLGSLGVGVRQLIEIASALSRDCRVLILDEPTAALTAMEADRLFERLHRMRASGISMIYVSHRLDEIKSLCDRIAVLRDGVHVGNANVAQTSTSAMVAMMTGEEPSASTPFRSYRRSSVALRVYNLCCGPLVQDVSFEVKQGERLGLTGLVGSGRSELLRSIFGADHATAGNLSLADSRDERRLPFSHPRDAVRQGIALVTEDRKRDGLLLTQSIRSNLSITTLGRIAKAGWIQDAKEAATCQPLVQEFALKCDSIEQPVNELSGGNQQKVVMGKWMLRDAEVMLLDEPTRGIDVDARQRIYRMVESEAANGKAFVILSSDLQELLEHCDAIMVMSAGRIVARFERDEFSVAAITAASFSQACITK